MRLNMKNLQNSLKNKKTSTTNNFKMFSKPKTIFLQVTNKKLNKMNVSKSETR